MSKDIVQQTQSGAMPPWRASGPRNRFLGDARLLDSEKRKIKEWVDGGMPKGDPKDTPPQVIWPKGWKSAPDHILQLKEEYELSADGPDEYVWFVLPSNLLTNRLIKSVEFRPEPAENFHHMLAFVDTSDSARKMDMADPKPGYRRFGDPGFVPDATLGAWALGALPHSLPTGYAKAIKAHSDVVVQVHFTKRGKPAKCRLKIGLRFANEVVKHHVVTLALRKADLSIPAGRSEFVAECTETAPLTVELLALGPHMHFLGRKIRFSVEHPDGKEDELLRINDWDFNWQMPYVFPQPKTVHAGSVLRLTGTFDNSAENPLNPNRPPKLVSWGPSARDEMLLIMMDLAIPEDPLLERKDVREYLENLGR